MSTELPPCDQREQTEADHVYFCHHPRMHVADGLVSGTICQLCSVRTVPVTAPRTRDDVAIAQAAVKSRNVSSRNSSESAASAKPFPSLLQQGWNLTQSLGAFVADGLKTVTKEQYEARLSICNTCDRRSGNRCLQCGCGLTMKAKGRAFQCPLKKWPSLLH